MTTSFPRWVHMDPPRAASPDSWWSLRSARVPPVHYLDKLLQLSLGATPLNLGVQVLMAERVRFRTPVDSPIYAGSLTAIGSRSGSVIVLDVADAPAHRPPSQFCRWVRPEQRL